MFEHPVGRQYHPTNTTASQKTINIMQIDTTNQIIVMDVELAHTLHPKPLLEIPYI